jgi:ubiquinone/menaquinone biosynthesis C-methylase UbiE
MRDRQAIALDWIDDLGLSPGAPVLEVGCAAGFLAVALARRGYRVHAVDRLPMMTEVTRRYAAEPGASGALSVELGDVYALPFRDGSFAVVVALGLLPWLDRPDDALVEMARVTRPGGHVVFSAANRASLTSFVDPAQNPGVVPLRNRVLTLLERLGIRARALRQRAHSRRSLERAVSNASLMTVRTRTHGFQFSCFYRDVLPARAATAVHVGVQGLADAGAPVLRSLGRTHILIARKPA